MKTYPSIPKELVYQEIIAFDKLDGSNIRAEWSKKKGFYKFGSRRRLIDESEPYLGKSIPLIIAKYKNLETIFKINKWEKVTCFFELYGPSSFAGEPVKWDIPTVTLIDVSVHKKGMLEPFDFIKLFADVDHAKVLYKGLPTNEFITSVKTSTLEGMTLEGVVCKGSNVSPGNPLMFKIKSDKWIELLKQKCGDNTDKFKELS